MDSIKEAYTAGDLHFAIWDFVADYLAEAADTGVVKEGYDDVSRIKAAAVKTLDLSIDERILLERYAYCVLCASEMTCVLCPMTTELGGHGCNSNSVYVRMDDMIGRSYGMDDIQERKKLLAEAHEMACMIRDISLPPGYAGPLCKHDDGGE